MEVVEWSGMFFKYYLDANRVDDNYNLHTTKGAAFSRNEVVQKSNIGFKYYQHLF